VVSARFWWRREGEVHYHSLGLTIVKPGTVAHCLDDDIQGKKDYCQGKASERRGAAAARRRREGGKPILQARLMPTITKIRRETKEGGT